MRIVTAVPGHAVKHLTRRRHPGQRLGPVVAATMLAGACALMLGGVTARALSPAPSPSPPPQRAATLPMPTPTALELPAASPVPRPAPPATVPPGGVQGIEVPSPVNLPPVAVLPAPAQSGASRAPVVPWGLLAGFLATLLIATGLTARRHR